MSIEGRGNPWGSLERDDHDPADWWKKGQDPEPEKSKWPVSPSPQPLPQDDGNYPEVLVTIVTLELALAFSDLDRVPSGLHFYTPDALSFTDPQGGWVGVYSDAVFAADGAISEVAEEIYQSTEESISRARTIPGDDGHFTDNVEFASDHIPVVIFLDTDVLPDFPFERVPELTVYSRFYYNLMEDIPVEGVLLWDGEGWEDLRSAVDRIRKDVEDYERGLEREKFIYSDNSSQTLVVGLSPDYPFDPNQ